MSDAHLISGDARRIPLADESVHCIVTSPPYWGLRKYAGEQELLWGPEKCPTFDVITGWEHEFTEQQRAGISGGQNQNDKAENGDGATNRPLESTTHGTCVRCGAWRGAFGLEPTVELYVRHSLEVLRELRRVLRKDGVLFWNLGDSYCGSPKGSMNGWDKSGLTQPKDGRDRAIKTALAAVADVRKSFGPLKAKDLVLMPARIALAAQADGWWVRSMIVWAKPNPMPESVTDRPADSYEYILMLTKSARYFWDADAVRENSVEPERMRCDQIGGNNGVHEGWTDSTREVLASRNMRNVWMFATQPYAGAHFATFPEELPRRCILAATSARGACAQCGAPWERIVNATGSTIGRSWHDHQNDSLLGQRIADPLGKGGRMQDASHGRNGCEPYELETVGWSPTCRCRCQHGRTVPCVVLDPFAGSGTTGRVSIELNRRAVLLDLAYGRATAEDRAKGREYDRLATRRLSEVQRILPL